ncbi:hypothetical protein HMPREF0724_14423 [Prescottella equi ATCC 33707]|uniref:Uncharacterized protein n=1 Tax=Prescottella equi ATCC 33707 TaxID=525370 RepID=E9T6K0_RHOHA|nr:hypothetical protein HMPREF0724_14423 [Prescottella equi ATCC 33707]
MCCCAGWANASGSLSDRGPGAGEVRQGPGGEPDTGEVRQGHLRAEASRHSPMASPG